MAAYKVEICGVNTAKLPILKESEKEELFAKIKQGDMAARETYIKGNLRLVLSVIKRFSNHNENVDDLFQIGCIGLIKSIDNFNPDMGVKFSTYAVPMIIGEIRRYLRDNNSIRVSRSLRDTAYKAIHAKEILTRTASTEPTLEDIAKEQVINQTSCEVRYISKMMPFETTEDTMRLYNFIKDTAKEFGFRDFGYRKVGGASDASYLTIVGVPTLCSCGVVGEWNHTMREYAIVDTMYERAKLFATAILNIDKFDK